MEASMENGEGSHGGVARRGNHSCFVFQVAPPTIGIAPLAETAETDGRKTSYNTPVPMFISTAPCQLEEAVVEAGQPIMWHTTNKMGVIFRIQADERFALECNNDPKQAFAVSSRNANEKYDVYVPTGIPIATLLFNPITVRFRTEFYPDPNDPEHGPTLARTNPLPVTVYGHRWTSEAKDLPMFPDCVVPFHRNFLRVNHVVASPLFQMHPETFHGF